MYVYVYIYMYYIYYVYIRLIYYTHLLRACSPLIHTAALPFVRQPFRHLCFLDHPCGVVLEVFPKRESLAMLICGYIIYC